MQFLKTLFWVVLAVGLALFARANWVPVTIDLWGGLQADVKLPVIVIGAFLLGFLPTFVILRARIWSLKRRLDGSQVAVVANSPVPVASSSSPVMSTATGSHADPERIATDSKVWPAP